MAITRTLTKAVPYNKDNKVEQWDLTMKYEEGADATYYTSDMTTSLPAVDGLGNVNFTPKAEASWTLAEITALCPIAFWDEVFDNQYSDAITNPPDDPVPDPDYVLPS